MANPNPFLKAALTYVRAGFAVLSCHSVKFPALRCTCDKPGCTAPGKHSQTLHGFEDVTTNSMKTEGDSGWRMSANRRCIIGHTQYVNPCTAELLIESFGDEEEKFAPAVEEPDEGGCGMSNRQPLDLDQEAPFQIKDKRGGGWFRIDNALVDGYLANRRISRDAYAIYTVLVRFANWKTGTCYPAIKTLCQILGYKDRRTLHKHLNELIKAKLIEMKEQEFSRGGKRWTGYLFTLKSITAPPDDDGVELFHPMEGDGVESMQTWGGIHADIEQDLRELDIEQYTHTTRTQDDAPEDSVCVREESRAPAEDGQAEPLRSALVPEGTLSDQAGKPLGDRLDESARQPVEPLQQAASATPEAPSREAAVRSALHHGDDDHTAGERTSIRVPGGEVDLRVVDCPEFDYQNVRKNSICVHGQATFSIFEEVGYICDPAYYREDPDGRVYKLAHHWTPEDQRAYLRYSLAHENRPKWLEPSRCLSPGAVASGMGPARAWQEKVAAKTRAEREQKVKPLPEREWISRDALQAVCEEWDREVVEGTRKGEAKAVASGGRFPSVIRI